MKVPRIKLAPHAVWVLGIIVLLTQGCHRIFPFTPLSDAAAGSQEEAGVGDAGPRDAGLNDANLNDANRNEAGVTTVSHYWSKTFLGTSNDVGNDVAVDGNNNVYVVGTFQGAADFGDGLVTGQGTIDTFLVSYTAAGGYRWARDLGGTGGTYGESVAVDGSGNVFVTGRFGGSTDVGGPALLTAPTGYAIFLASYTADGAFRWAHHMGGSSLDQGNAVTVDPAGNVTVTGRFGGTTGFVGTTLSGAGSSDIFLASFANDGSYRWAKSFGTMWGESGNAIHADTSGHVFVAGSFGTGADLGGGPVASQGTTDGFLASYTSTGDYRWARVFYSDDLTQAHDVVTDGAGNVLVTGAYEGSPDLGGPPLVNAGASDIFLASYTNDGSYRWAKSFGGVAKDAGNSLAVDTAGNVFVTGEFFLTADFGGTQLTAATSGSGDAYDIFVASYSSGGAYRWAQRFGSTMQDHGRGIAVDSTGRVVVTGEFMLEVDFGGGPLTASGRDAFLLSLH